MLYAMLLEHFFREASRARSLRTGEHIFFFWTIVGLFSCSFVGFLCFGNPSFSTPVSLLFGFGSQPFVRSSFTCFSSSFAFCPEIKLFKAVCLFFKSLLFVILTDSNVSTRSQSYPLFPLKMFLLIYFACVCMYFFCFEFHLCWP